MKRQVKLLVLGISLATAGIARAAAPAADRVKPGAAGEIEVESHPTISSDGSWAGVLWLVIGGMFLAAAVIGPVVRANTPEEVPPAHSHDEPPGASHHHGTSGTHAVEPHH